MASASSSGATSLNLPKGADGIRVFEQKVKGLSAAQLRTTAAATISLLNEWLQSCTQIFEETTHTRHDINK